MRQRVRTPMREIRDVDLGPKPANLFATGPTGGDPVVGGEIARPDHRVPTDEQRARWVAEKRAARARRTAA